MVVKTRSQINITQTDRCIKNNCHDKLSCDGDTLCIMHKIKFLRGEFRAFKIQATVVKKREKNKRYVHKFCNERSCENLPFVKGKCARHSGMFYCKVDHCTKLKQRGGFCIKHGGTCTRAAICKTRGCKRFNQGGGFCRTHGGGKRCRYNGDCKSIVISDIGFCNKHLKNVPTQVLVSKYMNQI